MKNIKDLTEQDCIHCATQEEWDAIARLVPDNVRRKEWNFPVDLTVVWADGVIAPLDWAKEHGYTIHPASDFLTPTVNVLTEIGDTKVIRHNDGCIVIKDDKAMTLTKDIVNWIKENI